MSLLRIFFLATLCSQPPQMVSISGLPGTPRRHAVEVSAFPGPQQARRIPIDALSSVRPVDVCVQSVRLRTMPARSLPGHARLASGERICFDYTDLVVLHPVLHRGQGWASSLRLLVSEDVFLLLELSLSGTSTRIKLKTTCRSHPERCDQHKVGARQLSWLEFVRSTPHL